MHDTIDRNYSPETRCHFGLILYRLFIISIYDSSSNAHLSDDPIHPINVICRIYENLFVWSFTRISY